MRFKRMIAVFLMCVMAITNLTVNVTALMNENNTYYAFSQTEKYWLKNPATKFNIEYKSNEYNGKQISIEGTYHGEGFSYFLPVSDYMVYFTVFELLSVMSYQYNTEIKAEDEPDIELTPEDIEFTGISAATGSQLVYIRVIAPEPNITSEYNFSKAEKAAMLEGNINISVECEAESETDRLSVDFACHYGLYTLKAEYSFPAEKGCIDVDIDDVVFDMCDYYNTVIKEPEESDITLSAEDVEMVQIIGLNGTVIKNVGLNRRHQASSYSQETIPEKLDGYLNLCGSDTAVKAENIELNGKLWDNAVLNSPEDIFNKENDSDYMIVVRLELEEEPKLEFDQEKNKWLIQIGTSSWYVNRAENAVLMTLTGGSLTNSGINETTIFDFVLESGKTSYTCAFNAEDINAADDEGWFTLLQMGYADKVKMTAGYVKVPEEVNSNAEFTYSENYNGTLTVTGYEGECGKLVIPEEIDGKQVTAIGARAFSHNLMLRDAVIPEGVEIIKESAFEGCRALKTVNIPDSVQYIEQMAFKDCVMLTAVETPDKIDTIESNVFRNCISLKSVTLPKGLTNIMYSAFFNCISLISIDIPANVNYIGDEAFRYCTSLDSIVIPEGVTMIGYHTFEYCSSLRTVVIPDSVTTINSGAFGHCSSLYSVKIPHGVTSIEMNTFENCTSLKSVEIPNNVTSIGRSAFENCSSLESLNIPGSVEIIDDWAFGRCTSLKSIVVPENITQIGQCAFTECSSLVSAELPDNGASIGEALFADCTSLVSFEIPKSMTTVPNGMFRGCKSLTTVVIHDGLTVIEPYAFADCTSLASIDIPDSVTNIKGDAFRGSGLKSVKIPKGVTTIEGNTFYECKQLASVFIPNSVTSIEGDAFRVTALVSVEIPDSVTSIGRDAFAECLSLTSVVIPASVTDMDLNIFALCPYYLTIYGYTESRAETYANENQINFVSLDNPGETQIDGETGVVISPENSGDNSLEGKNLEVEKTEATESSITFNITLTDENGNESQPEKPVTVSIPLPSEWNGSVTFVYRREANGTYTDMKAVFKDGRIVFTTDHFSEYIVTTEKLVTIKLGDPNGDTKISTVDAKWVLQAISGSRTLTEEQKAAADVNGDGKITTVDAKWILQVVSGSRVL